MKEGRAEGRPWTGQRCLVTADTPLAFRKPKDLLLWGYYRQRLVLCSATDRVCVPWRGGPSWEHCSPSGVMDWGPNKRPAPYCWSVVSDHIDLFPSSFCAVTVSLESVVILFVSFSHHQESAISVASSLAVCRESGPGLQPCCRHRELRGQGVHFTYLAA